MQQSGLFCFTKLTFNKHVKESSGAWGMYVSLSLLYLVKHGETSVNAALQLLGWNGQSWAEKKGDGRCNGLKEKAISQCRGTVNTTIIII